jgi:hypothetical protein
MSAATAESGVGSGGKERPSSSEASSRPVESMDHEGHRMTDVTSNMRRDATGNEQRNQLNGDGFAIHQPEADNASMLAGSMLNSYAPSSIIEREFLLPSRRRAATHSRIEKTAGRKTFEGISYTVNLVVPIDINSEAKSMRDSSLARLARFVQGKEKSLFTTTEDSPTHTATEKPD